MRLLELSLLLELTPKRNFGSCVGGGSVWPRLYDLPSGSRMLDA